MQPIKVTIKNLEGKQTHGASFDTHEEANDWIAKIQSKDRPWNYVKEGIYNELPEGVEVFEHLVEDAVDELTGESVTKVSYKVDRQYILEIEDLRDNYEYQLAICHKNRKENYGEIGEQLDEIYKDVDAWRARIKKVKEQFPKPNKV